MSNFDPDAVPIFGKAFVRYEDYTKLLQMYRDAEVKAANAVFEEQTDAAIIEAEHIHLSEGNKPKEQP